MDEPIADLSALGFHALSRLAARHVTVALCGQGPDELYGGYAKHKAAALLRSASLPRWARAGATRSARFGGPRFSRIASTAGALSPTERLLAMSRIANDDLRRSLIRGPLAVVDASTTANLISRVAPPKPADALAETLFMDGQLALVDDMLHFTDRTSMAHSLEVRVPYLDYRLVEQSARLSHAAQGEEGSRRSSCSGRLRAGSFQIASSTNGRSVSSAKPPTRAEPAALRCAGNVSPRPGRPVCRFPRSANGRAPRPRSLGTDGEAGQQASAGDPHARDLALVERYASPGERGGCRGTRVTLYRARRWSVRARTLATASMPGRPTALPSKLVARHGAVSVATRAGLRMRARGTAGASRRPADKRVGCGPLVEPLKLANQSTEVGLRVEPGDRDVPAVGIRLTVPGVNSSATGRPHSAK